MGGLLLDERMLTWVFLPIIYVTFLIQLFRFYFTLYSGYTATKKPVKKINYQETKDKLLVAKCDNLAKKGLLLTTEALFVMMGTTIPAMAWINSFFAGFVLAKVPFSLTQQFRSMTQSGIDMSNLDVSYVSSVSFYFLIVFGLNQINSLMIDEDDT